MLTINCVQLEWVVTVLRIFVTCECEIKEALVFTGGGAGAGGGIFDETATGIVKCHVGEEAVLRATIREDLDINKDDVHLVW